MKFIRLILVVVFVQSFTSCEKKNDTLNLFYTINYKGDSWQNHKTALLWALSYLGAELPKDSLDKSIIWQDSTTFKIDFKNLGFDGEAQNALRVISDSIRKTNYYKEHAKADLGLFIALTIGSSWHYYKLTAVPERLSEFYKTRQFKNYKTFGVTRSSVAKHHRRIKYSMPSDDVLSWLFVAEEGDGNITDGTFEVDYYEVFDIMPNGQLRFAVYNKNGQLTDASPKHYGQAGKPVKCMWCHEIVIQPLFVKTDSLAGFISPAEFQQDMAFFMEKLKAYREGLNSDLDFSKTQDHTQMELEYISFMQPSVQKLMQEWKMSAEEVESITKGIEQSQYPEFKFLGDLFKREQVNRFRDFFPESIREPNKKEINFFKK